MVSTTSVAVTPGSDVAGIRSLWSGLSASILRQTTYSTARFALYDILARNWQRRNGAKLSAGSTIACAGIAGGLAGMIGNPTEVVNLALGTSMSLTRQLPDSSRPDVCRWREGTSPKISLPERHSRADQNWKRRRLENFHKRLRTKCCKEYLDEWVQPVLFLKIWANEKEMFRRSLCMQHDNTYW
jgi:hypothetical protein